MTHLLPQPTSGARAVNKTAAAALALALGCTPPAPPLAVRAVDPIDAAASLGEEIVITGTGFAAGDAVHLAPAGADRVPLVDARVAAPNRIEATVPAGVPAGRYDVVVAGGNARSASLPGAFTVYDGDLEIRVLDVGQGDAQVIRAPNGRALVVDGGKTGQGTARLIPYLDQVGKPRPEFVLVTHFDNDHLGGIDELLQGPDGARGTADDRGPLEKLLDHGDNHGCATQTCQLYYELRAGAAGEAASPGQRIPLGAGARVTVAAVNGDLFGGTHVATSTENENSIALLVEFGGFRYLTAGDLTGGAIAGCDAGDDKADVETPLGRAVGTVDLLHVNHHGSCTSTNPAFLSFLQPRAALISVGENNAFCHPSQRVLNQLSNAGTPIFLTAAGMTEIRGSCTAVTQLPATAAAEHGDILVSTRDGASFRVRVLSGGSVLLEKTFP